MWCNLFYDKYAGDISGHGDHHYKNEITKLISISDLVDGSYNYFVGKKALENYNSKFSGNFALEPCVYTSKLFQLMLYQKNVDSIEIICVVVGVNTTMLEKYITDNQTIPHVDFLKKLCRYHMAYTETAKFINNSYFYNNNSLKQKIDQNIDYIIENVMKPTDYTFDNKIENLKELDIKLYEYQKCNIYWMCQKENNKNKNKISYNLNEEITLGNTYYDMTTQKFNLICNKKSLQFNGGAIIDEVGLGKTLQVIGLGIVNPSTNTSYQRNDYPNKFFSKATLVFCPNQLCGQWIRELKEKIKKDFDPKIISLMTKRDFDKFTYNDLLDADFVVVSFTFLDNKCFTLPWTSKISTSKSFNRQVWQSTDIQLINKLFSEMGKELLFDPMSALCKTNPLIQLIHWHRFVIDEFHEIYKDHYTYSYIDNLLEFITADNKWCVTATPFNKKKVLNNVIDFLTDYKNKDGENILNVESMIDYLIADCFRRNTKDSVKEEHTLPPIKEEIRWLKFSPTERMIYNAYLADPNNDKFSVYLRQLCCHPQLAEETKEALSNCKTLNDIEKMMVTHYKLQVEDATEKVNKIKQKIIKNNKKIDKLERKQKKKFLKKLGFKLENNGEFSDSESSSDSNEDKKQLTVINIKKANELFVKFVPTFAIDGLRNKVKTYEMNLKEADNILEGKTKTCNFFSNVVEKIKKTVNKTTDENNEDENITDNDDDICGICLDDIPENDIGVTMCGHIFCFECLKMTIAKYHACPYCKKKLADKEIYVLSYERKKKEISLEEKNKADLINDIGTKLANLITYLRESGEHTIIFSQWDDLLRRVGRILKENKIPNVFCKGNCYQRDKAIREFNSDHNIKVIMLSSDSTAAGTNLTKASQVIFIDPIYGDYTHRKGQERQAIGRAHRLGQKANIKVVRFVIKDTIEEEIYKMNIEEDKKHKKEFAITSEINVN